MIDEKLLRSGILKKRVVKHCYMNLIVVVSVLDQ